MDLRESLQRLERVGGQVCPMGRLLADLDAETREVMERLLGNPGISTRSIHRELHRAGVRMGAPTIADHRQGRCRCL